MSQNISPEEREIKEFELESETQIVGYFMKNLHKAKYQPSPIDLRRFYLTQVAKSLPQIKDRINQNFLWSLIKNHSSIH